VTTGSSAGGDDAFLLDQVARSLSGAQSATAAPLAVGVAVSGGGDSVALLHILHRAAPTAGLDLRAVTVDHGLRAQSASEASQVAGFCRRLGIPHHTLVWHGPQRTGNLMDQARRARIGLIGNWARTHGVTHVALGHTADDQAETFLMNLARTAGLDGLSGMRPSWAEGGVHWSRPLLQTSRAELRSYLRRHGVDWVDDPTNDDDRYARVRTRQALKTLEPLGITVEGLNRTMAHLRVARSALQTAAHDVALGIEYHAGALRFGRNLLLMQPSDIIRRLLIAMIRWMNGTDYPPREAKVCQLERALATGRTATLGGVRFQCQSDLILVTREVRAVTGPVSVHQKWDHRWQMTGPRPGVPGGGLMVAALGAGGLRHCPDWRATGICRTALIVTPAIWAGDTLIAAPLAGLTNGWQANVDPSFQRFVLSH
jgi:tRNA(Ile)-lysidine synthase